LIVFDKAVDIFGICSKTLLKAFPSKKKTIFLSIAMPQQLKNTLVVRADFKTEHLLL
jgi:hypothetical protein